ncbi:hypothetical protein B0J14DRAFT_656117 [Halenospora varia]|nr:hypothetical protein B0J14DRAFT_656117 [Halenospora varia]
MDNLNQRGFCSDVDFSTFERISDHVFSDGLMQPTFLDTIPMLDPNFPFNYPPPSLQNLTALPSLGTSNTTTSKGITSTSSAGMLSPVSMTSPGASDFGSTGEIGSPASPRTCDQVGRNLIAPDYTGHYDCLATSNIPQNFQVYKNRSLGGSALPLVNSQPPRTNTSIPNSQPTQLTQATTSLKHRTNSTPPSLPSPTSINSKLPLYSTPKATDTFPHAKLPISSSHSSHPSRPRKSITPEALARRREQNRASQLAYRERMKAQIAELKQKLEEKDKRLEEMVEVVRQLKGSMDETRGLIEIKGNKRRRKGEVRVE